MDLTRRGVFGASALITGAAFGATPMWGKTSMSMLGTSDQIAKEALALKVMESAPFQAELRNLEQIYAQDAIADLPGGRETLKSAAASLAMSVVLGAVNKDPDRPAILWGANAAHKWHGLDVPRSGLVQDNPDNVYRSVTIEGAARYEIRGRITRPGPAQQTFVLYNARPASEGGKVKEHLDEAGVVALDRIPVGSDGAFVITIDSSPVAARTNHLQTSPDSRNSSILIRDSLADWATENPVNLSIRRVDGPPVRPAPSEDEIIALAAKDLRNTGRYWLDWEHRVFFSRPTNSITLDFPRASGWGWAKGGHFRLADDEALIATFDRKGAAYFAIQLADLWGPAVEYTTHNGSLNQTQASPDRTGAYTFVVAVKDPGVHNWLDPAGLSAGTFVVRWQNLPPGTADEGAVRAMKVVKLQDLKEELPPETAWLAPAQRRAQLAERFAGYTRRLTV